MAGPTATTPVEWFKADAGAYKDLGSTLCANTDLCEQWNDQSGNGNNATQTSSGNRFQYLTNKLNGLPGLKCVRSSSTYMNRVSSADPQTIFIVAQAASSNFYMALLGADEGNASPPNVGSYYFQQGPAIPGQLLFARCTTSDTSGASDFFTQDGFAWSLNTPYIHKGWRSGTTIKTLSGPGWGGVSNSTAPAWSSGTSSNALRSIAAPIVLGADVYNRSVTDSFDGILYEALIYNVALSDVEMGQVEAYLFGKWIKPASPTYLLGDFFGTSGPGNFLQINSSQDGQNFLQWPCQYTRHGSDVVRDTSLLATTLGGLFYIIHTPTIAGTGNNYVDLASSPDGMVWTYITSVDCSSVSGIENAWAPEWFADAGAPHGYRVFLAIDSPSIAGGNFQIYEIHPTNSTFTTWSTPSALTGTGLTAVNMIDPQIIKVGSVYYLLYNRTSAGGTVGVFSSSSLLSGYTALYTDLSGGSHQGEGPCMTLQGSNWVLYYDTSIYGGGGIKYQVQAVGAGDWTGTNLASWSAPALIVMTPDSSRSSQQGTVLPFPMAPPFIPSWAMRGNILSAGQPR